MDALTKLSRDAQIVLGGALLYVIFSFLNWQQVSIGPITVGVTEWAGIGYIAALLGIALFLWEAARAFDVKIPTGSFTVGLISVGLATLLIFFTVITFLTHGTARYWPSYIGLVLSIVIGVVAFRRAKTEGVEMPTIPRGTGSTGGVSSTGAAASAPPAPPGNVPGPEPTEAP
jgi:hypothetical protein